MKYTALILLFIVTSTLYSQEIYTVDLINNNVPDLPFDQDFTIKIKDPHNTIESAEIFRLFMRKGQLVESIFLKSEHEALHSIDFPMNIGKYTYLKVPALRPNLHFEVILHHKFRGKAFDSLLEVFAKFSNDYSDRFEALEKLSYQLEPLNAQGKPRTIIGAYWLNEGIYKKGLDDFFENKIKIHYNDAVDLSKTVVPSVSHLTEANLRMANTQYKIIDKSFEAYSVFFSAFSNPKSAYLFTGEANISYDLKAVKPYDLRKRVNNLNTSIELVDKLIGSTQEVLLLNETNAPVFSQMVNDFKNIKKILLSNKQFLTGKVDKITKALDEEKNMRYATWFSGTNEVRNLKTQGSYILIPNIGVTQIFTPQEQTNFTKPFIGVSLHLRQVNKSIPLKEIKNSALHRIAIQIGLTVSEIKDSNAEYFDLMNKMSLMTGVNYKINHAVGLSAGAVFMKRADPNPLITKKQTVANFYAALTIDVDFANSIKSLTGKFGL